MSIVANAAGSTEAAEPQDDQQTAPRLVMLDPHQVEPEQNIRWNVDLDKEFVASIKQHGVLVPVLARTDTDGTVLIRDGRRRLMAARETGHELPPSSSMPATKRRHGSSSSTSPTSVGAACPEPRKLPHGSSSRWKA